jgi:hypothetical protein
VDLAVRTHGFEHWIVENFTVDGHRHSALKFLAQSGKARFKGRHQSAHISPVDVVLRLAPGADRQGLG